MDEFNDMIGKQGYSEEQLNMCRDIRKRGKNKVVMMMRMMMMMVVMVKNKESIMMTVSSAKNMSVLRGRHHIADHNIMMMQKICSWTSGREGG